MNISSFFIDRPIFASVISIVIVVAGTIAIPQLPISEYPEIVPPTVVVNGQYPGASPKTIAETVITPLEQQINGVENAIYVNSSATPDGNFSITVTFRLGTDLDNAQVQTQNRVSQAETRLPQVVRQIGLVTRKSSPNLTLVIPVRTYNPKSSWFPTTISSQRRVAVANARYLAGTRPGRRSFWTIDWIR
jgi:multidrug efflux pump subunit AcrB